MADQQPQVMPLAEFLKRKQQESAPPAATIPLAQFLKQRAAKQKLATLPPEQKAQVASKLRQIEQKFGLTWMADHPYLAAGMAVPFMIAAGPETAAGLTAALGEYILANSIAEQATNLAAPHLPSGAKHPWERFLLDTGVGALPFVGMEGAAAVANAPRAVPELPPPTTPVRPVWELPPDLEQAFPRKPPEGADILSKPTPELGKTSLLTRGPNETAAEFEKRYRDELARRPQQARSGLPLAGKTPVITPSRARGTGPLPSLPAEEPKLARPETKPAEPPPIAAPSPPPVAAPEEAVPPTAEELERAGQGSMFAPPSKAEQAASDAAQRVKMDAERARMEALEKEVEQLRKQAQERPVRPDEALAQAANAERPIRGQHIYVPRKSIGVDPERFQFKRDVEKKTGAGRALSRVRTVAPESEGTLLAWRDPEGKLWLVNGHHRFAMYDRLAAEGKEVPENVWVQILDSGNSVPGAVAHNVTDSEARVYGAMVNIRDGKGSVLDAAKVLREGGMDEAKLDAMGVDLTEGNIQKARALASLTPPLWRKASFEELPQDWLIEIGQKLPGDEADQVAALKMIDRERESGKRVTGERVADLIDLVKGSAQQQQVTADLFGAQQTTRSLVSEKADLIGAIRDRLRFQKRIFGTAAKNAGALEQADVASVNVARGAGLSKEAAQNLLIFDRLAKHPGTQTSAVINRYAEELASAKTRAAKDAVMQRAYNDAIDAAKRDLGVGEGGTQLNASILPLPQAMRLLKQAGRRIAETEQYQRAAGLVRSARYTALSAVAPERVSAEAMEAYRYVKANLGEGAGSLYRLVHLAEPIRTWFKAAVQASFPNDPEALETATEDVWRWFSYKDRQLPAYLSKLEPWKPVIRDAFDYSFKLVNSVKDGALRYKRDYFPVFWDKPEEVKAALAELRHSGRSLRGPMGFLHERAFETEYLLRRGFKFRYKNPGDLIMAGLINEWRFVMGNKLFAELKGADLVRLFSDQGEAERQGWVAINDSIAHVYAEGPPEVEGGEPTVNYVGRYYAPRDVARVINNMLAPDPTGNALYRLVNNLITGTNMFRVAFGAFHYTLETGADIAMTRVGAALRHGFEGVVDRNPAKVARALVELPRSLSPIGIVRQVFAEDLKFGGKLQNELVHPGSEEPDVTRAVGLLMRGGARFTSEQHLESLMRSADSIIRGVSGDIPIHRYYLEKLAKPLMGVFVPRVKLAATMRMIRTQLERDYENGVMVHRGTLDEIAQDANRHVEDMMGQMAGDNFALHPAARAALRVFFSFPQFQIGTVRAEAGAFRGAAKALIGREPTRLEKMALSTFGGTAILVGAVNSMLQYALTGTFPHNLKELFIAPWDGSMGQNGERGGLHWANYVVPWFELAMHPVLFLESRFGQVPRDVIEYVENRDWRNVQIHDPDASLLSQIIGGTEHLAPDTLMPFVVSNARRMTQEGVGAKEPQIGGVSPLAAALSFMGLSPAPYSLSMTPDEKLMQRYLRYDFPSIRDPRQVEVDDLKRDFLSKYRKGQRPEAIKELSQALAAHKISDRQVKGWLQEVHQHPDTVAFKRLKHLDQAVRVYLAASPAHRALYKDALLHKLGLTPDARGRFHPPNPAEMQALKDGGLLTKLLAVLRDERQERQPPPEPLS